MLKEFTFELQIENYSISTTETYNYNTTHFIQYLDEFHEVNEIEDVSTVHVKIYIQHQLILGKKATSINTVIKSLRCFTCIWWRKNMSRAESLCDERYAHYAHPW